MPNAIVGFVPAVTFHIRLQFTYQVCALAGSVQEQIVVLDVESVTALIILHAVEVGRGIGINSTTGSVVLAVTVVPSGNVQEPAVAITIPTLPPCSGVQVFVPPESVTLPAVAPAQTV